MKICGSVPVRSRNSQGLILTSVRGTCSPELLVRQLSVSFQGQTLFNAPIIKPVSKAKTWSWYLWKAHVISLATDRSPTRQPAINKSSRVISRDLMAARTGAYIPIITRMKLPEMPGRIIAHIATAPAAKNVSADGLTWPADKVVIHHAAAIPNTRGQTSDAR